VTPEEVQAATFAGAAEKVIFRRALSDMKRQVEATRMEAAKTMGGIRHELSARALAACFSREASARVREECVNALTRLGMQGGLLTMERALADPVALVRLAAVRGTYRLAGPGCGAALIPMLCDGSEDVRRRAATCIGWLGERSRARELVQLLDDASASVRSAALDALANLGSQRVVPEIIGLLNDPTEPVRRKASDVLRAITGERKTLTVPGDEGSRRRLIARWRAWWEQAPRVQGSD
jgi:HEAT repeat protein